MEASDRAIQRVVVRILNPRVPVAVVVARDAQRLGERVGSPQAVTFWGAILGLRLQRVILTGTQRRHDLGLHAAPEAGEVGTARLPPSHPAGIQVEKAKL